MDLRGTASSLLRNIKNIPGWTTGRKLVVIESDDWGSIRMPSREVYEKFDAFGFKVRESQYNRYDALESNEDLEKLFEVLDSVKGADGRPACFTANTIVSNPDFEKIRQSGFTEYHYEHFTETLRRCPQRDRVFDLYREGMASRLFRPQFHGREHLNVNRWMKALKQGGNDVRFAFDHQTTYSGKDDYSFMEALDMDDPSELSSLKGIVADGLTIFAETFGYESRSFIAPCYTWDSGLDEVLTAGGVRFLQGGMYQFVPRGEFGRYKKAYHYLGEKTYGGNLTYLVRNSAFEPTLVRKNDWVQYTLTNIRDAFRWKKPAIITAHRLNFIGSIDADNRNRNLKMLKDLLSAVVVNWPDVSFVTSDELGDLIVSGNK